MPSHPVSHLEIRPIFRLGRAGAFAERVTFFLLASGLVLFISGCVHHRSTSLPPVATMPLPLPQPAAIPPATTTTPETTPPAASTPPKNPTTAPAENPPKPVDTAPPKAEYEPPRPPAPQISPQMSASAQAELEQQTKQYISDAEKNLHSADGRTLNANQSDMVEKIRGFLKQAHDAALVKDWARGKSLAQKAYLLSVELTKTF